MPVKPLILLISILALRSAAQSVGGTTSGAAAYCDSVNSGFISLSGYTGQILFWETSENLGSTWLQNANPTSTQSYFNLKKTTMFRAVVKNGNFPQDTSSVSTVSVHVPGIAGNLDGGGTFCQSTGNGTMTLRNAPGTVQQWQSASAPGGSWTSIPHTSFTYSYSSITQNRWYRVVVQTVPGCPADTSAVVAFSIQAASVAGSISGATVVCPNTAGDTLRLSGHTGSIVSWISLTDGKPPQQIQSDKPLLAYPAVTTNIAYRAVVKNGVCAADTSAPALVAMFPVAPVSAGPDASIVQYETLLLSGSGSGSALWQPSKGLADSLAFSTLAKPLLTQTYVLTVTDANNCRSSDSVVVTVIVPVPTAITPNGDGQNDFFVIHDIADYGKSSLRVFDRWGLEVYSASPYKNDWNGRSLQDAELPEGFYFFVLEYGGERAPVTNYILIKRSL